MTGENKDTVGEPDRQAGSPFADANVFRAVVDTITDYAIYTIDADGLVSSWNASLRRLGGWQSADVLGRSIALFFPPEDGERVDRLLADARRLGSVEFEGWRVRKDGTRFWANTVITALPGAGGGVRGFVVVGHDRTERRRLEEELRRLATMDPLTGTFNRRHGQIRLVEELRRRARYRNRVSVLLVDIDHFKTINDRFGHEAGDDALRSLVAVCNGVLRRVDIMIRWGGEEFLILLPETGREAALRAGERVRSAVSASRVETENAVPFGMTVSIGAAEAGSGDADEVIRRADTALHSAKAAGRNRVALASGGGPDKDAGAA